MAEGVRQARRVVALGAIAFALVALGSPATAQTQGPTLHVDRANPSCSNTGPGTEARPLCTIGAGASRATAGTTVLVHEATYTEQVSPKSGASGAPIVFKAAPGETPTVTGSGNAFYLSNRSWVRIEGFRISGKTGDGIYVSKAHHIEVIDNEIAFSGQPLSGEIAKGVRFGATTDSVARGNRVHHNTDYGIYLLSDSTRNTIAGNEIHDNARQYSREASGIRLHDSPANTIANNVSYRNEDSGIELVTGSSGNVVVNNVSYDNGDHGIDVYRAVGQRIVANTVFRNLTAGINAESSSTSTYIANNVSVDNAIDGPRTRGNIRVDSSSTSGTTMNYDLVHLSAPGTLLVWSSTSYTTLAAFRAASGQEASGIEADPRFVDPSGGDFRLQAESPAIDSANSGALAQPSADNKGLPRVDNPSTPNTGVGPRPYDDRGAHEYQLVEQPPSAALSVSPDSGLVALTVTADASASTDPDPGSPIASYQFDFGDGSPHVGPQPGATATHTYTIPGTYTVTVTVRDTSGLSSTATHQVLVTNNPPVAALSVTPASGEAPLNVTADASASTDTDGAPIASYEFDFGDGSPPVGPQAGATAAHTYTTGGAYTVTVTVRDTAGLSSTATATVSAKSNLIGNPSFETDLAGWNTSGSGANITLTRVAGGHDGSWAVRLANTGTTNSTCVLNDSPNWVQTVAGTYTTSLWVRADSAGAILRLRLREYNAAFALVGQDLTSVTLTTAWQKVTLSYTPLAPGSTTLDLNAYVTSAAPGTCFYADSASVFLN